MTDDERFRNAVIYGTSHPEMYMTPEQAEIERLRAENEKLRAVLKRLHEAATEATEDLIFGEWWKEELAAAAAALKETDNA